MQTIDIEKLVEAVFPEGETVLLNGETIEIIKDRREFDRRIAGKTGKLITIKNGVRTETCIK